MPTALITGAARGIGRALAASYLADGWRVLAVCRDPAALAGLDGIAEAAPLDVTDDAGVAALARRWREERIDLLWNNAGVASHGTGSLAEPLDTEDWARCLRINTVAPMVVAAAFAPHVAASERQTVAFVSSQLGSIARASGGRYGYNTSKAALNMAARSMALDFRGRIRVAILHPGHVSSDMGGRAAPVTPEESAAGMRRVADRLPDEQSGAFLDWQGRPLPW